MKQQHFLYVIAPVNGDQIGRPCKVGITKNPAARLRALQTAWPHKLIIYELWNFDSREGAGYSESLAHACLQDDRMSGEWFDVSPSEAVARITVWMRWSAEASARDCGEDTSDWPEPPAHGVGMVANGFADHAGKLRPGWW